MRRNAAQYTDCGEVNCTELVEAWDSECASGGDTLDSDHVAWTIAVEVADEIERRNSHTRATLEYALRFQL